jgi:pimeloyl-ACP methyl ester carboxylesterase
MGTVMSFVAVVAAAYLALCALMFATQRSQIYFPTPESHHSGAQVLRLESHGERINVWHVPRPGVRALIYFGGNAEDTALDIDAFSVAFPDHSLYLVNYRGYGGSSGRPEEAGLLADALTVYDHVRTQHSDITAMGRSLGSGVAVHLASERPVTRLVLVTPYDSLVNVARHHFRFLPVGTLMRDRYDSASRASKVRAPVLVVIAEDDEIIPRARSEALVAAFPAEQVRTVLVSGQGHNTLDLAPAYLGSVAEFLTVAGP